MVTLTVDRMHTRYVGEAARYGDQLSRVVDSELDAALTAVSLPAGHVCVRSITVPVRLGPSGAARSWAEQIASALAVAARAAVVYPRTLDAVVDLLVSAGRRDLRRSWAWRQLGLSDDPGRPDAAVAVLCARPELAVAALVAAAARGPVPLTAAGWVSVARRVGELAGPLPAALPEPSPGAARFSAAVSSSRVARRLPPGVADLPAPDRRELARLLLLCAAPASARSAAAVAAVGALLGDPAPVAPPSGAGAATAPPATATAVAAGPDREPGGMEGADPARDATGWAPEDADRADRPHVPPAGSPPPAGPEREVAGDPDAGGQVGGPPPPAVSPAGGMLFLVAATGTPQLRAATPAPLPGTGPLADRPLSTVVAQLAARLGEVGLDDPAVHVLAGQPREPFPEPTPDEEAALGVLAEDVRAWLRALLRLEPDDDLRWLWHRPARIAAEPGWVEATFSLDDVDTRVRAAGLDLDPGFVWWLGSVVRYRYA